MLTIYLSIFNAIAAVAFILMWIDDRRHWYLFHWGLAVALAPINVYCSAELANADVPSISVAAIIYVLSGSYIFAGLILGAQYFREASPVLSWRLALLAVSALLWFFVVVEVGFEQGQIVFAVLLVGSYIRVAWLLWSPVIMQRLTSIFFLFKAAVSVAVLLSLSSALGSGLVDLVGAGLTAFNILLLIVISAQKAGADLKRNIQLLGILHSVTAAIHAAKTEQELGKAVVKILVRQPYWNSGLLLRITADGECLKLIHGEGVVEPVNDALATELIPLKGTMTERAINEGKVLVLADSAVPVHQFNDEAKNVRSRYVTNNRLHFVIPVVHRGSPEGALVLTDLRPRKLARQELETLTSIGEVVGFALKNIQQLATLNYRASHDVLTGLGNRHTLHKYCQKELLNSQFTLMLFDLDDFKEVNDVFGHEVGDSLLQALANDLTSALAGGAKLFRLGGDEFVVVYLKTTEHQAESAAAALLELIKQPRVIGDLRLQSGASIGVVETSVAGNDSHELLRCADLAMYKAKHSGTGIAHYDAAYDAYIRDRVELLADVKEAIQAKQFELYYQPVMDLRRNSCFVCEALLRWHHPSRGFLNAGEFIPVIETTEHIVTIAHVVIELALQDLVKWREQGVDISVAINLSARNFLDPSLADVLIDSARAYQVPPERLHLEITETVLMKDPQMAESITKRLHEAGFKIIIDDFGTGYSSLSYLARFPISTVKIDQNFVGQMERDKRSKNIVEATIDLTHKLDFSVTAEGVEREQTASLLKDLQCDYVQGFLYSKPVNKAEFDRWFNQTISDSN